MNILYLTCGRLHPTQGGTERTTITIATALKKIYGAKIYSIYERPTNAPMTDCLDNEFLWKPLKCYDKNIEFLRNILLVNEIDTVIIQGAFIHVKMMKEASNGLNCKIIFAHHYQPGGELAYYKFIDLLKRKPKTIRALLQLMRDFAFFPKMRKNYVNSLHKLYKEAYEFSDKTVLLSRNFIDPFSKFGSIVEKEKFRNIPNGLSFAEYANSEIINNKKKNILIVSRLEERHKNISKALKIWEEIKKNEISKEWNLIIVGEGPEEKKYKKMVKKSKIPHVYFMGRQDPFPYYKDSSIFMMTSRSESWGLTLTESQQMGTVPIAFQTYESLSDIITDKYNGFIIKEGDIESYVKTILKLMENDNLRKEISKNAIKSSVRFDQSKVAKLWWQLINEN